MTKSLLIVLCLSVFLIGHDFKGSFNGIKDINDLDELLEAEESAAVFFYNKVNAKHSKILNIIDKALASEKLICYFGKSSEFEISSTYGLSSTPGLILFQNGIPNVCPCDLSRPSKVINWIQKELKRNEILTIEPTALMRVVQNGRALLALPPSKTFQEIEINKLCSSLDIDIVRVSVKSPVYYENNIPTVYEDSSGNFLEWIKIQRTSDTIEDVSEEILQSLIVEEAYLAILFTGPCVQSKFIDSECERILEELETIDDELDNYGIILVTTEDIKYAGHVLKIRKYPALGIFRNGHFLLYEGSFQRSRDLLYWLISKETLKVPGRIEEVNAVMLEKLLKNEEHILVFFYDTKVSTLLHKSLESLDEILEKNGIEFVKISEKDVEQNYGFFDMPLLLIFENRVPSAFDGEFTNSEEILSWSLETLESNVIPSVELPVLEKLIETQRGLLVIFYDSRKKKHLGLLEELEDLDVIMVRNGDGQTAKLFGCFTLPCLIYYENEIPDVYRGELKLKVISKWLNTQNTESHIKKVTRELLEDLIENQNYVAVLHLLDCERSSSCEQILENIEKINEFLESIDIIFVYLEDSQNESLVFYRNGVQDIYFGDLRNHKGVLQYLTSQILIPGTVPSVEINMLNYLIGNNTHVFAFLYQNNHKRSEKIIKSLEKISHNGILVKCSTTGIDKEYGIGYLPRLIHFTNRIPEPFDGNELNRTEVQEWFTSTLNKLYNYPYLVTRSILEKLIEKEKSIGAFITQDGKTLDVVGELENVVVISDSLWAKQLGLYQDDHLLHFSYSIPSLYRGEFNKESLMSWLNKMRDESVIEEMTVNMLKDLTRTQEYVAVLFKGSSCSTSLLEELEEIDDELEGIGIIFVTIEDEIYPREEHDIVVFPAIGLYRNEDFLLCTKENPPLLWFQDQRNYNVPNHLERINRKMLNYFYETNEQFLIYFYDKENDDENEILTLLERINEKLESINITFAIIDENGDDFGITSQSSLVLFQRGIPNTYEGYFRNDDDILMWVQKEITELRIQNVNSAVLQKLIQKFTYTLLIFYDDKTHIAPLQSIINEIPDGDIAFLSNDDSEEMSNYGIDERPALVFIHNNIPSLVSNIDLSNPQEVVDWILRVKTSAFIEEVTDEILFKLIRTHEYVAVIFKGKCEKLTDEDCSRITDDLETIDDELDNIGILLVSTYDTGVASKQGIANYPTIGLFRNGHFVQYVNDKGSWNKKHILKWLLNEETLKIIGIIDEVNMAMLNNILKEENDAFVFFYKANMCHSSRILEGLESIDEKLDKQDLSFVKISETNAPSSFGIEKETVLVYFENEVPELYSGDLLNYESVYEWMKNKLTQDEIKEISVSMLNTLIERDKKTMAVLFMNSNMNGNKEILKGLESIDETCKKYDIDFVRVNDHEEAISYGIEIPPGLIIWENKIPSVYDGDLRKENDVLHWLIKQKTEDNIEKVTDEILERLISSETYLAVYFSGPTEDEETPCSKILEKLNTIDSIIGDYGIMLVMTEERDIGRINDIKSFPALGMFRNEDFLLFEGELENEIQILEWIMDKKNLQILGQIESVNYKLLYHLLATERNLLVFFHKESVFFLRILEAIDDDLDEFHIEFVQYSQKFIERDFGVEQLPSLVYYRNFVPSIFKGNLKNETEVLIWALESSEKNQIEDVNDSLLDLLIKTLDNLAVVFINEKDEAFLKGMESLDDDLDKYNVGLVKCSSEQKALEFGIDEFPSLIYFKKTVPNLYDGNFEDFKRIRNWLLRNKKVNNVLPLVSEVLLENLITNLRYVSVLFTGTCKDIDCERNLSSIRHSLENIKDDIAEIGVTLVLTKAKSWPKEKLEIQSFPSLGLFRNGQHFTEYKDSTLENEAKILSWLSNIQNLQVEQEIEILNSKLLKHFIESEDNILVYFSLEENESLLEELNVVDEALEIESVKVVQIVHTSKIVFEDYGLPFLASLVHFDRGVASLGSGTEILPWIQKDLLVREIRWVSESELKSLLRRRDYVLVVYYNERTSHKWNYDSILENCNQNDISVVQIENPKYFSILGLTRNPTLIYYENAIANIAPESQLEPFSLLEWLLEQRNTATIERVTDEILNQMIESYEYVAVLFLGVPLEEEENEEIDKTIMHLEKIDHHLDEFGIYFVMTHDLAKAKEHWISRFPSLVYYRNGEFLKYKNGLDLSNENQVLEWLTSKKTCSIPGAIEEVNELMLTQTLKRNHNIFVFFYKKLDVYSQRLLARLEDCDSQLEALGIDFVKISEADIALEYNLESLPSLIHFVNGEVSQFYGDIKQYEMIAQWIEEEAKNKKTKKKNKKKKKNK